MKIIQSGVERRTVIEAYAKYDCSKTNRTLPDFASWDWSRADTIRIGPELRALRAHASLSRRLFGPRGGPGQHVRAKKIVGKRGVNANSKNDAGTDFTPGLQQRPVRSKPRTRCTAGWPHRRSSPILGTGCRR